MDGIAAPSKADFLARFGHVFEHSPWVAERAWIRRPFADRAALHQALMAEVYAAPVEDQIALLNAHPELAARVELTDASAAEQQGAGLQNLTKDEFAQFTALNAAYRAKFGFPFIICVRLNTKSSILAAYKNRLANSEPAERAEAIAQIGHITRLRLADLLQDQAA